MKSAEIPVSVEFIVVDDMTFRISYDSPLLQDRLLDYLSVPEEQRHGQSRRLLCALALACFSSTVYMALKSRGARTSSLKGIGVASAGKSNAPTTKVNRIDICVEVDLPEDDAPTLKKVKKIVEKGCLVTQSIAPSITVRHSVVGKRA